MKYLSSLIKIFIGIIIGLYVYKLYILKDETKTVFSFIDINKTTVGQAYEIMRGNYVDNLNLEKISDSMISAMVAQLDPHSRYISAEEANEEQEKLVGEFSGVGIEFTINKDTIYVVHAISGGPSEKVGIVPGDKIVKINDTTVAGKKIKTSNLIKKLRGKKGTKVKVSIKRAGFKELIPFKITRDKIPIYSLDASFMLNDKIGYIKLNRFSATTYKEFINASKTLLSNEMENLVIDLRGNGGGYMNSVIMICNEILNKGDMIVYTKGRKSNKEEYYSDADGLLKNTGITILVDEASASASEILAGAIQDNDRGTVIGRRTFGKGLVQKTYSLQDMSLLILTVSKYYTPSGRNIQKPYSLGNTKDYLKDYIDRINNGELFSKDSIKIPDSLIFKTKQGKTVFGGGGIMPDIFVPIDTTYNSKLYRKLIYSGIINRYVFDYVDSKRDALLKKYKNINGFISNFKINQKDLLSVVSYGKKKDFKEFKIKIDHKQLKKSEKDIKIRLKAMIGRALFSNEDYYKISQKNDLVIKKAIEQIKKKNAQ